MVAMKGHYAEMFSVQAERYRLSVYHCARRAKVEAVIPEDESCAQRSSHGPHIIARRLFQWRQIAAP